MTGAKSQIERTAAASTSPTALVQKRDGPVSRNRNVETLAKGSEREPLLAEGDQEKVAAQPTTEEDERQLELQEQRPAR